MTIDIVDYSAEVYEVLTSYQYYRIELAQHRKNTLLEELDKEIKKERQKLIEKGIFVSELFDKIKAKLQDKYDKKIEMVKKEISIYISKTMLPGYAYMEETPYVLNYALCMYQRYKSVKKYYLNAYTTAAERFAAFRQDVAAIEYLGDYYETLYSEFVEAA